VLRLLLLLWLNVALGLLLVVVMLLATAVALLPALLLRGRLLAVALLGVPGLLSVALRLLLPVPLVVPLVVPLIVVLLIVVVVRHASGGGSGPTSCATLQVCQQFGTSN
jgi:hypothetical protein